MTHDEEAANAGNRPAPAGQMSDEDLEAVTGGLARPLERDVYERQGIDRESDGGQDDAGNG